MKFSAPNNIEFVWVTSLDCNANCSHCFQSKDKSSMSLEDAKRVILKLKKFLESGTRSIRIYFQGGEAMALPPEWYEEIAIFGSNVLGRSVAFSFQTNLIGYNSKWGEIFRKYFDSHTGSSLDWPNLYRVSKGRKGEDYNILWKEKFEEAKSDGISVGVISVLNRESVKQGAEAFVDYYHSKMGITLLQLNYLFSGVEKVELPDPVSLGIFIVEVMDISKKMDNFYVSPYNKLVNSFSGNGFKYDFCIHSPSCSLNFLCVRPNGMVSLCDCWVAYSPQNTRFFGNFIDDDIESILNHQNRINFMKRAFEVVSKECLECNYHTFCHGGCPVRAFKNKGDILVKDYYCETYKIVFDYIKEQVSNKQLQNNAVLRVRE